MATEPNSGSFKKGEPNPGKGRTPGVPNVINRDIKEMILTALTDVGGAKYLAEQAYKNPTAFMALVGKVLPLQVNAVIKRDVADMTEAELLAIIAAEEQRKLEEMRAPPLVIEHEPDAPWHSTEKLRELLDDDTIR